jgi:hypothetical protein
MPYIKQEERKDWADEDRSGSVSALAYTIVIDALSVLGLDADCRPSYEDYAKVIGAIECAKMELYRRLVAPYEEGKIEQNGDVKFLDVEEQKHGFAGIL